MKGGRIEKMRFVEGDKSKVICNFCNKIIPRTKYTDHCLSLHPTSVDCFRYTASKKYFPAASVWSKNTLNSVGVGGAGADPQTCKMWTSFLMPIFNYFQKNRATGDTL